MSLKDIKIIGEKLILPKHLAIAIKLRYPLYQTPALEEYSDKIIDFSRKNKRLPFYLKFDINNDGKDEVMIIHRFLLGGRGRLLIISEENGRYKFNQIKWKRPVNALFFDYYIDIAEPAKYRPTFYVAEGENSLFPEKARTDLVDTKYPHVVTVGYTSRVVYWNGEKYCEENVTSII